MTDKQEQILTNLFKTYVQQHGANEMKERQLKDGAVIMITPVHNGFILRHVKHKDDQEAFVFSCRLDLADFLLRNLEPKG